MVLSLMSVLLVAAGCGGQQEALQRFEGSRVVMGTTARVVLYAKDEATARVASAKAFTAIERMDETLSDYRDDSVVQKFVKLGRGTHMAGMALHAVLQRAARIHEQTNGAFDVTVGPVVALWREKRVPTDEEISAARKRMGGYVLHPDWHVELLGDDMHFDFGGIGKGFAAQTALAALDGVGVDRALVDIGGDIALGCPPPGTSGWQVEIPGLDRPLVLSECGVAGSGDGERGFTVNGVRYSHVVDPRTGRAMTHRRKVWVVASDAVDADAFASAYSVMERERAREHANRSDDVHLLLEYQDGALRRRVVSHGFPGR